MRLIQSLMGICALILVVATTSEVQAQKKVLKPNKEWRGANADESLIKGTPECIVSAKGLENLWKRWSIQGDVPKVDFDKEIVIVGTTRGSGIGLSGQLDDKGNLQIVGIATADLRPGFRYVVGTLSREGVKTVNKKELPKE